ncbi:MAG: NUDIX hydrolase [Candidatus Staskawiczbacteria bacterium]|nr:NUDIX hydrolase [Candidatus Staskawiczbacteria bacterium]
MNNYNFQYCQKIIVFSNDLKSVLLCRRKGESDYDKVYSFIGGKMETTDTSFVEGLKREKNEEVGADFKIEIYPFLSANVLFKKNSGDLMVLPHYYARHLEGKINLNEEYDDFKWVGLKDLKDFGPKIPTIDEMVEKILALKKIILPEELVVI